MMLTRWLTTFLAFPVGGWLAIQTVGSIEGPLTAAAGAIGGAVIGAAQWLALRPRGIGPRWAVSTAVAMAAGSALATALTGARTEVQALMLSGLVTGALVGGAQAATIRRGPLRAAAWTGVVSLAWSLGWLTTWSAGIDVERGYLVFGASGAIVATLLTSVALWRLLDAGRGVVRASVRPAVVA
ncbi:MAG: hypothetical protein HY332_11165 [Chloroflexi bacterium]|nr:hypothetical protein [Chloroflexota bacterium]